MMVAPGDLASYGAWWPDMYRVIGASAGRTLMRAKQAYNGR
jgi:hypothetical protein